MTIPELLKAVRKHFKLSDSGSTLELSHLYFALLQRTGFYGLLIGRTFDTPKRGVIVAAKDQIIKILRTHTEPRLDKLSDAALANMLTDLRKIARFIETIKNAFANPTDPKIDDFQMAFNRFNKNYSLDIFHELEVEPPRYSKLTADELTPLYRVAATYLAESLPELYFCTLVDAIARLEKFCARLNVNKLVPEFEHQLVKTKEFTVLSQMFKNGIDNRTSKAEVWEFLNFRDEANPKDNVYLYLEDHPSLASQTAHSNSRELSTSTPNLNTLSTAVNKQIPTLLIKALKDGCLLGSDGEEQYSLEHAGIVELIVNLTLSVYRTDEDMANGLAVVSDEFPTLQGNPIECARLVIKLISTLTLNRQVTKDKRSLMFEFIKNQFAGALKIPGFPDIIDILPKIVLSSKGITHEQIKTVAHFLRSEGINEGLRGDLAREYAKALNDPRGYKTLRRLAIAKKDAPDRFNSRHDTFCAFAEFLSAEQLSKLVLRTHKRLPSELKDALVLMQPMLLSDKYKLFSKRSANRFMRLIRTYFNRYYYLRRLLGDAPGDDFNYDVLLNKKRAVKLLDVIRKNPLARAGMYQSRVLMRATDAEFAQLYLDAFSAEQASHLKQERSLCHLITTNAKQQLNTALVDKLWRGLRGAAAKDPALVKAILAQFYQPKNPLADITSYCSGNLTFNATVAGDTDGVRFTIDFAGDANLEQIWLDHVLACFDKQVNLGHQSQRDNLNAAWGEKKSTGGYQLLQQYVKAIFNERNPQLETMLLSYLNNANFERLPVNPMRKTLEEQLNAGRKPLWSIVFANPQVFKLFVEPNKNLNFHIGANEKFTVSWEAVPKDLQRELEAQMAAQKAQHTAKAQRTFAAIINDYCEDMSLLDAKQLRELLAPGTNQISDKTQIALLLADDCFFEQLKVIALEDADVLIQLQHYCQRHSKDDDLTPAVKAIYSRVAKQTQALQYPGNIEVRRKRTDARSEDAGKDSKNDSNKAIVTPPDLTLTDLDETPSRTLLM